MRKSGIGASAYPAASFGAPLVPPSTTAAGSGSRRRPTSSVGAGGTHRKSPTASAAPRVAVRRKGSAVEAVGVNRAAAARATSTNATGRIGGGAPHYADPHHHAPRDGGYHGGGGGHRQPPPSADDPLVELDPWDLQLHEELCTARKRGTPLHMKQPSPIEAISALFAGHPAATVTPIQDPLRETPPGAVGSGAAAGAELFSSITGPSVGSMGGISEERVGTTPQMTFSVAPHPHPSGAPPPTSMRSVSASDGGGSASVLPMDGAPELPLNMTLKERIAILVRYGICNPPKPTTSRLPATTEKTLLTAESLTMRSRGGSSQRLAAKQPPHHPHPERQQNHPKTSRWSTQSERSCTTVGSIVREVVMKRPMDAAVTDELRKVLQDQRPENPLAATCERKEEEEACSGRRSGNKKRASSSRGWKDQQRPPSPQSAAATKSHVDNIDDRQMEEEEQHCADEAGTAVTMKEKEIENGSNRFSSDSFGSYATSNSMSSPSWHTGPSRSDVPVRQVLIWDDGNTFLPLEGRPQPRLVDPLGTISSSQYPPPPHPSLT